MFSMFSQKKRGFLVPGEITKSSKRIQKGSSLRRHTQISWVNLTLQRNLFLARSNIDPFIEIQIKLWWCSTIDILPIDIKIYNKLSIWCVVMFYHCSTGFAPILRSDSSPSTSSMASQSKGKWTLVKWMSIPSRMVRIDNSHMGYCSTATITSYWNTAMDRNEEIEWGHSTHVWRVDLKSWISERYCREMTEFVGLGKSIMNI